MATLTYDPTSPDQPEFNEAEQEALAIGEAQAAAEQELLAGKFKDAEELEKAYLELQSKLGSRNTESKSEELAAPTDNSVDTEDNDNEGEDVDSFLDDLWQETISGELSPEIEKKLRNMSSVEVAAEYLKYRNEIEAQSTGDISDAEIASIRNIAGGEDGYKEMLSWASENLSQEEIEMYDSVIAEGSFNAINFAVHALKARYTEANGIEGQLLKGKPASNTRDVFRSQAEVVQAMADPRYDKDPAYRNDVFAKLERSNIQY